MPDLQPLVSLFVEDPILGYSLLAALFLALVSITAGLARLDLAALGNPRPALMCALCVAAAVLLRLLIYGDLQESPVDAAPMMAGLEHLPLLLAALAYGPTPGLVVAALYANFGAQGELPLARQGVLALELTLVGWLAIYPSPREHRWAGPLNVILGHTLAWATAGLALAQWQFGGLGTRALLEQHSGNWTGVIASALLLLLIRPAAYRWLFPQSRIYETAEESPVVIEPITDDRGERIRTDLTQFDLPPAKSARRRRRSRS